MSDRKKVYRVGVKPSSSGEEFLFNSLIASQVSSWEIRGERGSVSSISSVRVEDIYLNIQKGQGVDEGFHKFLKKVRNGEKLFVFVWLGMMGDVI